MAERIAVKRLSKSDLTFFEPHIRQGVGSGTNQKCINLNANPFSTKFFPELERRVRADKEANHRFPIVLTVARPGGWPATDFSGRSITRSAKNWRLETMISEPQGQDGRFVSIKAGDPVVFRFGGDSIPTTVDMVILSKTADAAIADQAAGRFAGGTRESMVSVTPSDLQVWADAVRLSDHHPLRALAADASIDTAIVEATFGNEAAARTLRKKAGRPVTDAEIEQGKARAAAIGKKGETLAWEYLKAMKAAGGLLDAVWTSKSDAAASWDFDIVTSDGTKIRMDAKSTSGTHAIPIHMSGAQIAAAAESVRYDVMRISSVDSVKPKARIAENIATLAKAILEQCAKLPNGILPDGFSIAAAALNWGPEVAIDPPETPQAAATDTGLEALAAPVTPPKA